MDEGGLYYWGEFDTIELLIACLEDYLGRPIEQWRALGPGDYLARPPEAGTTDSHGLFKGLLASGQPLVPTKGHFTTSSSSYWFQFLKQAQA